MVSSCCEEDREEEDPAATPAGGPLKKTPRSVFAAAAAADAAEAGDAPSPPAPPAENGVLSSRISNSSFARCIWVVRKGESREGCFGGVIETGASPRALLRLEVEAVRGRRSSFDPRLLLDGERGIAPPETFLSAFLSTCCCSSLCSLVVCATSPSPSFSSSTWNRSIRASLSVLLGAVVVAAALAAAAPVPAVAEEEEGASSWMLSLLKAPNLTLPSSAEASLSEAAEEEE